MGVEMKWIITRLYFLHYLAVIFIVNFYILCLAKKRLQYKPHQWIFPPFHLHPWELVTWVFLELTWSVSKLCDTEVNYKSTRINSSPFIEKAMSFRQLTVSDSSSDFPSIFLCILTSSKTKNCKIDNRYSKTGKGRILPGFWRQIYS